MFGQEQVIDHVEREQRLHGVIREALACLGEAEKPKALRVPEERAVIAIDLLQVAGNLRFLGVSPGGGHTSGVTVDSQAYCWGANSLGQLGSVAGGADRLSPTPVAGGLRFKAVKAGTAHTCGVTTAGRAYCWGWNGQGQLGDGRTGTGSAVPVPVGGS